METTPQQQEPHSQKSVPLFSALSLPISTNDKNTLQFLIKLNHSLVKGLSTHDGKIEDIIQSAMKEEQRAYKPLVVVGPSGAGKGTLI